ncbi:Ppx/GppA phosphatase family protein [Thermosulfuriphilus sp.]
MVKKDLVNRLAEKFPEYLKKDLEEMVDQIFARLTKAVIHGERVEIRGFGRFIVRPQKGRIFINPKTGERQNLPPRRRVIFKVGKDLKERLSHPVLAALDLGTQTFRLLIGQVVGGKIRPLYRDRENVRLGEGLAERGEISPGAFSRGIETLRRFQEAMTFYRVKAYQAIGTAVFRKAGNGPDFLRQSERLVGIKIDIIDSQREADLSLKGVMAALPQGLEKVLVVDAGGGSTEFILAKGSRALKSLSLELGAVILAERFIHDDPPGEEELQRLEENIKEVLKGLPREDLSPVEALVATGGTATSLAALKLQMDHYDPDKVQGYTLSQEALRDLFSRLKDLSVSDRRNLRGLEPGREDIILPGVLIYLKVLEFLNIREMLISDAGILEGILLDLAQERGQENP